MALEDLDPIRIVYIYGLEGAVFVMFLLFGLKTLKRDKQRLNLFFSGFYLTSSLGLILNFIYVPLSVIEGYELTVLLLNYSTIFVIAFSLAFLVISLIIILKSTVEFSTGKQIGVLIGYAIMNATLFLFIGVDGVIFTEETDWIAAFSTPFYLYLLLLLTFGGLIPTVWLALIIRRRFESKQLKKRWDYFISGLAFIFMFMYMTYTINYVNRTAFRSILMDYSGFWGIVLIAFIVAGGYMLYYGIGKQLNHD